MSANELLLALSRMLPAGGLLASTRLDCRDRSQEERFPPVAGSLRAAVSNAILLAALSVALAGCGVLPPATTARTTPPPRAETKGAQELASVPKPTEASARPARPVPQLAPRVSDTKPPPASVSQTRPPPASASVTKPPPATVSKGAEKLVAPTVPAPVRASERTTLPAEPSAPKTPIADDSGTVTGAPVQALIFQGPPPQARPRRVGMKGWWWLGPGLGGAALAVLARLYLIRRAKPAEVADARKDELKPAPGLLMKEPLNLPQEAAVAEES